MFSAALLASYAFDDHWKLAGRVEYETESGHSGVFTTPDILGYGPGSNAWSVTLTPTYQWKQFFARTAISYVTIGSCTPGLPFGSGPLSSDPPQRPARPLTDRWSPASTISLRSHRRCDRARRTKNLERLPSPVQALCWYRV